MGSDDRDDYKYYEEMFRQRQGFCSGLKEDAFVDFMSQKLQISKVEFEQFMLRKFSKPKDKSLRVQVPPPPSKTAPKIRQHQGLPPPPKGLVQKPVSVNSKDCESYGSCLETHFTSPRSSGIVPPPPTANVPKIRRQGRLSPPPPFAPLPKGQGQRMPCALAGAKLAAPVPQKKKGKGLPPPSNGVQSHGMVFPPPSKVVSSPKKGYIPDRGDSSTEPDSQGNSPSVTTPDSNDNEMPGTTLKLVDDGVHTDSEAQNPQVTNAVQLGGGDSGDEDDGPSADSWKGVMEWNMS